MSEDVAVHPLGRPAVVIRGDLISSTGYARAARALAGVIALRHEVLGVSLHEDPSDRSSIFPGELVSDATVRRLARERPLIVIHYTPPDSFLPIARAYNIGCFYWETRAIPRRMFWPEAMASMDAIWAPTRFVARFVTSCAYRGPVSIVPWPHRFADVPPNGVANPDPISVDVLEKTGSPGSPHRWSTTTFFALRAERDNIFLAVQSLSPRKGLPVLLAEWLGMMRQRRLGPGTVLLLKLNFRHAENISSDAREHFAQILEQSGAAPGENPRIALISETLDDGQMAAILGRSDCLVSASLGEGFGGPVVEALVAGRPVIAPRHTSLAELLPEDYPLQVAAREACVQLRDLPDIYPPMSTWFLPHPGALADKMSEFALLCEPARAEIAAAARQHAELFCGRDLVQSVVFRELARIEQRVSSS